MSEIDWSKAPEGATHYDYWLDQPFIRFSGCEVWEFWNESKECWFAFSHYTPGKDVVKRPIEPWTGAGLPPVGTVCEVNWCEGWHQCEIIGHFMQRCGMVAAFTVIGPLGSKSLDAYRAEEFRPIRTQEQIEAEEREAFALNLVTEMGKDPEIHSRSMVQARKIYDLGYRKQGEDK